MADKVYMEALSPTMEEGQVVKWHKAEGDAVAEGDVLADIETDKATMELVARGGGVLRGVFAGEGAVVPVGEVIAVIGGADEDVSAVAAAAWGGGVATERPGADGASVVAAQAEGGAVHHHPRGALEQGLLFDQPVRRQRAPGLHQVHDAVGEIERRGDLHRPGEADEVHRRPPAQEVAPRRLRVLGGDPEGRLRQRPVHRAGEHHAAASDPQVERRVEARRLLFEHIASDHAQVRGPVFHIDRHIAVLHEEHHRVRALDAEAPVAAVRRRQRDSGLPQHRFGGAEQPPGGEGDEESGVHGAAGVEAGGL